MKCPKCNVTLLIEEDLDCDNISSDSKMIRHYVTGFCPKCANTYDWTQHYTLTFEDGLKNYEGDDEDE